MTKTAVKFDAQTQKNINAWLEGSYDAETKAEVRRLIEQDPADATNAFYTSLAFGTGGLRGVMGVGTNRINVYTVRAATQGLATYLLEQVAQPSVVIGFDSRHQSAHFAEEAARVLAANNIQVYLFSDLRPTPLISFACRYKHCSAGIMITASHNPPEYNGYKVYWEHGGQVLPPHDKNIIDAVNHITDASKVHTAPANHPLITRLGTEIDQAYLEATRGLQSFPEDNQRHGHTLKVVYTNLHGAGITLVPLSLRDWGFTQIIDVEEQKQPDGNFPTVASPNPEEESAMHLGLEKLQQSQADLLLGTDPDTDRVGVGVRHGNRCVLLNGNQIACLCLEHLCSALQSQQRLPKNAAFVKTIVTTELFKAIATHYQRPCFDVLTGFKYIGELIEEWTHDPNGYQFIFGGEESYGYLLGTHVRDKDAVIIASLLCEIALQAKLKGLTLIDRLHEIYRKYGVYREKLLSLTAKGKEGLTQIQQTMRTLRQTPPQAIAGAKVAIIEDYLSLQRTVVASGAQEKLLLPQSDVLLFWLEDNTKLVIRPSGTEPKIKIYIGVMQKNATDLDGAIAECDQRADRILNDFQKILGV